MNRRYLLVLASSLAVLLLLVFAVSAVPLHGFDLGWHLLASGGGHASSADYALDGTAGQPAVGALGSADYQLGSGFWGGGPVAPTFKVYLPLTLRGR